MKVVVRYSAGKVIFQSETEGEPIEAARNQMVEVFAPELAVVKPGLIFHVAREKALHAADAVGRCGWLLAGERGGGESTRGEKKIATVHNSDCTRWQAPTEPGTAGAGGS